MKILRLVIYRPKMGIVKTAEKCYLSKVLDHHGGDAPEDVVVGQPVEEAVDGHGHVARLDRAVVLEINGRSSDQLPKGLGFREPKLLRPIVVDLN